MFAYKRTVFFATTMLAAAIAVAFAYAHADRDVNFPKAAKFDVSAIQSECPKLAWPYGCEWRPSVTPPTKHVSVQRRARHFRLFANKPALG
jgi:hypothetical protein